MCMCTKGKIVRHKLFTRIFSNFNFSFQNSASLKTSTLSRPSPVWSVPTASALGLDSTLKPLTESQGEFFALFESQGEFFAVFESSIIFD